MKDLTPILCSEINRGLSPIVLAGNVLQRVGQHPASKVDELTPRRWKQLFSANPLRSDLYGVGR